MVNVLESNKESAIEFYRMEYLGKAKEAVETYVGADSIKHNPNVLEHVLSESDYQTGNRQCIVKLCFNCALNKCHGIFKS